MANNMALLRAAMKKVSAMDDRMITKTDSATLIHKMIFPSPQLTHMFSGFSLDRIHQLYGPESSGKTTLACYIAANTQKFWLNQKGHEDKKVVVFMDYECTFDPMYAQAQGVNIDEEHFILLRPNSIEDGFEALRELIKTDLISCVIFDSDAAAESRVESHEDEVNKANFGNSAKALMSVYKKFTPLCSKYITPLIVISQERVNMDYGAKLPKPTGGNAIKFFSSTRVRVRKTELITNAEGETIGIKIVVKDYKNKTGVPFRTAEMNLYYDGGFKSDDEYIDFILKLGIIEMKGGGNFAWDEKGLRVRGKDNLLPWFQEHPELYEELKKKVDSKLCVYTQEFDKDSVAPTDDDDPDGTKALKSELSDEELMEAQKVLDSPVEE